MIQLTALPATANLGNHAVASASANPAGMPGETPDQPGKTPQTTDFSNFLTAPQSEDIITTVADESAALDVATTEVAPIGARAMLQQLAVTLQQGGKSLPVAGNVPAAGGKAAAPADHADEDATTDLQPGGASEVASPARPDEAAVPISAGLLMFGMVLPGTAVTPGAPATSAISSPSDPRRSDAAQVGTPSPSLAAIPALVEAQLHGRPLALSAVTGQPDQVTASADQAVTPDTRTITVTRNGGAPTQAFTISPGLAPEQPGAVRLRPVVMAKAALTNAAATDPALSLADPSSAGATMAMPSAVAQSTPGAPVVASAAAAHDFATLIDRLIEARDAASPRGIHVAMDHAEFGKVSLNFRQDANGLSVSVSSPNPDFARAVQAATPSASSEGAGAQAQSDSRHGSTQAELRQQFAGTSAQSQNGSQGRAPATDPRDNRIAANPAASLTADTPEATRQRGLFA